MSTLHTPPDLPGPDHRATGPALSWFTARRRRRLYLVAAALLALLGVYGLVTPEQSGPWLDLVGAALGVTALSGAAANTPRDDGPRGQ